jgi:hypothetical protein
MKRWLLKGVVPLALMLWACDGDEIIKEVEVKGDTVYDTLEAPEPGNHILEYNVVNLADAPIYSAIDHAEKTITVYLPHYYVLEFIEPEIVLPQGASVSPETGELVEVFSAEPVTYTVTARDGTKATYQLKIEIQQPQIVLDELGTAEAPHSIGIDDGIVITGKNFIPDIAVTNVYLIDEAGEEIKLVPEVNATERSTTMGFYAVETAVETGKLYWIEMRAYTLTQRMQYPIQFELPAATIDFVITTTVRQGETFVLQGNYIRDFTYFALQVSGVYVPLSIESVTLTKAVVRVPDDYPIGTHRGRYDYTLQGTTRNVRNSAGLFSLTVESKAP